MNGGILAKLLSKSGTGDLLNSMSDDLAKYASEAVPNKMFGTHSLNASKLAGADELGGFAMPSVAVRNANNLKNIGEFGDIVMLPKGEAYLPSRTNKVFSTDAYTPMMPRADIQADPTMWNKLAEKYPRLNSHFGKNSFDVNYDFNYPAADNASTLYDMLKSVEINPGADGVGAFRDILRNGTPSPEVASFIDDVNNIAGPRKFFAGNTMSGRPSYKDYTLQNAIKIMKQDIRENAGNVHGAVGGPSTMGTIEAQNSLPITSLKDMRERSKWLNADPLTDDKYKELFDNDITGLAHGGKYREINKSIMERLNKVANDLHVQKTGKPWDISSNPYENYDAQMNVLGDMDWYRQNSPELLANIEEMSGPMSQFGEIMRNQPVKYFESKPTRAVGFDDFMGAVLPTSDTAGREILSKRGVPILGDYDPNVESSLETLLSKLISEGKIPLYATTGILGGGSILGSLIGGGQQEYS